MEEGEMKESKIVLITGGSSNLGRVIVNRLSNNGLYVYSGYNSKKIENKHKNVTLIQLDVTNDKSVKSAVDQVIKKSGRIDVLINCAGITKVGKLENSTIEEFDQLLEINVKGVYRVIKKVLPLMKIQKSGKIINITSLSGLVAFPNFGIYSASKFALEAFTTALRYEVLKGNIWVTNIEPGAILDKAGRHADMPHKTFRQKYLLARLLLPLVTSKEIAENVESVIASSAPPSNVLVGMDSKLAYIAKRMLPRVIWDKLLQYTLT